VKNAEIKKIIEEFNNNIAFLQPIHIPYQIWIEIYMEFIMGLPTSEGKDIIFVIVDRLTKYAHFIGISSKAKASQIVDIYVKNIYKLHGFLKFIINDRDPKFTNKFWKNYSTM
jgi:hypothetical protein